MKGYEKGQPDQLINYALLRDKQKYWFREEMLIFSPAALRAAGISEYTYEKKVRSGH